MRLILGMIALTIGISSHGFAQHWEVGALGGYGWYQNSSISNSTIFSPPQSAAIGFPPRATIGVVFGENPYRHLGGEIRWLYQWGGPQIERNGFKTSMPGYSNLVTYDFVIYPMTSESGFRPYLAGGAGVKAYTGTGFELVGQSPTVGLALLRPVTQAEPAISAGGGLKYLIAKHVEFRIDVRAYFTPTPDAVIRPTRFSIIQGWLSEIVPTGGFSYVF
jgi:hypothetical protein